MTSAKPLDNFRVLYSRNVEEVREAIGRFYVKPTLIPPYAIDGFNSTFNNCRLHNVELAYSTFGAAVGLEFPASEFVTQLFPIRGKGELVCGRDSVTLRAGASAVTSPGASHRVTFSDDYEHLILRINVRALTNKLAAMTDATINQPLRLDLRQDTKHPAAQMLQQYLPLLAGTLSEAEATLPSWWVTQTEQLLMTLFLCGQRHNYSHLLEQDVADAAPHQVRQAEQYIEANSDRAITLEELAEVTGVSAFSLFSAFKKHRGYSPLNFLAKLRSRRGGVRR